MVTNATYQQPEPVETIFRAHAARGSARRNGAHRLSRTVLNNPAVTALLRGGGSRLESRPASDED